MTMPTDPDVTTSAPRPTIADQPPPNPTAGRPIWDLVIADMHDRDRVGRERYGTPLQAHNGRAPLVDAYQEALDLAVYLRQEIEERAAPAPIDTLQTMDPVAIFIDGHAKRLAGAGWNDLDSDEQSGWAAQVHDVLNNLRADEHGEVFDGRPGMAVPTGPEEPSAVAAPPAIPADLRALLEEYVAARDEYMQARADETDAIAEDARDLRGVIFAVERCMERSGRASAALIAWTRAHAGAAPAPLTDDELAAMWRLRIGTSPSPNGLTLMRAIRDHAGGGR